MLGLSSSTVGGSTTGSIRTLRNQSGSNGSRTIFSILSSGSSAGGGSFRRMYGYSVAKNNESVNQFYNNYLNLGFGKYEK
jgi:hypothetical protein